MQTPQLNQLLRSFFSKILLILSLRLFSRIVTHRFFHELLQAFWTTHQTIYVQSKQQKEVRDMFKVNKKDPTLIFIVKFEHIFYLASVFLSLAQNDIFFQGMLFLLKSPRQLLRIPNQHQKQQNNVYIAVTLVFLWLTLNIFPTPFLFLLVSLSRLNVFQVFGKLS